VTRPKPSFIATGKRIGAVMSTIEEGSITLPARSKDVDEEKEGDDA
jgi:hypothetical protein